MTGNSTVIVWDPPPRPVFTDMHIEVAEPSPEDQICYTATWPRGSAA